VENTIIAFFCLKSTKEKKRVTLLAINWPVFFLCGSFLRFLLYCLLSWDPKGPKLFQHSLEHQAVCLIIKWQEGISIGAVARKLIGQFKSLS